VRYFTGCEASGYTANQGPAAGVSHQHKFQDEKAKQKITNQEASNSTASRALSKPQGLVFKPYAWHAPGFGKAGTEKRTVQ